MRWFIYYPRAWVRSFWDLIEDHTMEARQLRLITFYLKPPQLTKKGRRCL